MAVFESQHNQSCLDVVCLQRIVEQRQPDNVDPAKAEKMKKSREDIVPLVVVTVVCNCQTGCLQLPLLAARTLS